MATDKKVTIRTANVSDCILIGTVHCQAWIETYTGLLPKEYLATRSREKSIAIFQDSQCQNLVVTEIGKTIVGFCGWGNFRSTSDAEYMGEIQGIYLLKAHQRKQYGRMMLNHALQQLKRCGYRKVGLWVLSSNESARRFYEKMWFSYANINKSADLGAIVTELLYTKDI
ncbi:MAG: GNAT family N-acetyltransferase [Clostridia bacterium]|nr:GNAT family N-acetyltransferase [Clostridia bacterium]